MDAARLDEFRRGHRAMLAALERLETTAAGAQVAVAVGEFLVHDAPALEQWLQHEESEILAALDTCLPLETETSAALRREHDTAHSLLALLRRGHEAARHGASWAEPQLASAVQDLVLLLRDHFRKEDGAVCRLLEGLMGEAGRG